MEVSLSGFGAIFSKKGMSFSHHFLTNQTRNKKINNKKARSGSNSLFQVHLFQLKFLRIGLPDPSIEAPDADGDNGARTPTGVWVCELARQQSSMGLEKDPKISNEKNSYLFQRKLPQTLIEIPPSSVTLLTGLQKPQPDHIIFGGDDNEQVSDEERR